MAGGGIKPGISYGATDDYCYKSLRNPYRSTTSTRPSGTASASNTPG